MKAENPVVDYLKKVTLELEAGSEPDRMDLTCDPIRQSFIIGVASHGITPFEKALFSRSVGESQTFEITPENACEILGHLRSSLLRQLSALPRFYLKARITHITQPENREVVQAITASLHECGDGCDCGCGCG